MKNLEEAFVHTFATARQFYLYDVNTNLILTITENIYKFYRDPQNVTLMQDDWKRLESLYEEGFLRPNPIKEIAHPLNAKLPHYLDRKVQGLTFQVTQQCNFRCKYCVYSGEYNNRHHSTASMSLEMAKKGVDFLIKHSVDLPQLDIGFYGGEPLLHFGFIKDIVSYIKKKGEGKCIEYQMTTNGTLFSDEIFEFLQENGFHLTISLDGPKEIHDQNRVFAATGKGTFDAIMKNIRYMKEKFPELYSATGFNAVLDPTLDPLCATDFFIRCEDLEGASVSSALVSPDFKKERTPIPEEFSIHEEQEMFKVFMHKLGRLDVKHVSKFSLNVFSQYRMSFYTLRGRTEVLTSKCHPGGPCVAGARKLFMNVHGSLYPCERVSEDSVSAKIGDIDSGYNIESIMTILNIGKLTEDECKKCWGIKLCPCCFAQADEITALSAKKRLSECPGFLRSHEQSFRQYCTLKERGFAFESDEVYLLMGKEVTV